MPAINPHIRDAKFGDKVMLAAEDSYYGVEVVVTNEYFHQPDFDPALYRRVISPCPNADGKFDFGIRVYRNLAEFHRAMRGES